MTFLLANWKYCVMGGLMVALLALFTVDKLRIDNLKNEKVKVENLLKQAQIDLVACQDANKSAAATIDQLKADRTASDRSCTQRLAIKDALLKKLNDIDAQEVPANEADRCSVSDPVASGFHGMFSDDKPGSEAGIHQTVDPGTAGQTDIH